MKNKTLNLSDHLTKERRHKEANLSDIVDVLKALPLKYKEAEPSEEGKCLSVKFIRGGGIDIKFDDAADCNLWYNTIKNIITK